MTRNPQTQTLGYRALPWAGFTLGMAVSIAGNVADAQHSVGAQIAGAFWPAALMLATHITITHRTTGYTGHATRAGLAMVASVSAVISYLHLSNLLTSYGEALVPAHIGPLAVDGLMIVCATAMLTPATTVKTTVKATPSPAPKKTTARSRQPHNVTDLYATETELARQYAQTTNRPTRDGMQAFLLAAGYTCSGKKRAHLWNHIRPEPGRRTTHA